MELERFYTTESNSCLGFTPKQEAKNGSELALALTNLTKLALSMCVHIANCPTTQ